MFKLLIRNMYIFSLFKVNCFKLICIHQCVDTYIQICCNYCNLKGEFLHVVSDKIDDLKLRKNLPHWSWGKLPDLNIYDCNLQSKSV